MLNVSRVNSTEFDQNDLWGSPTTLGNAVRRLREQRGIDQATLAARAGVSQQGVSKIERGLSSEPKSLPRICRVLEVGIDELLAQAGFHPTLMPRAKTRTGSRAVSNERTPRSRWPFLLPYQRFERLTHAQKLLVESALIEAVAKIEGRQAAANGAH